MKPRPYSPETVAQIDLTINYLKSAAALLRMARCPLTLKKVRSAIKSAEGARNNAHARQYRDTRNMPPPPGDRHSKGVQICYEPEERIRWAVYVDGRLLGRDHSEQAAMLRSASRPVATQP